MVARRLLSAWPAFAPHVAGVSEACRNQSERYMHELRELTLWAFQSEYYQHKQMCVYEYYEYLR